MILEQGKNLSSAHLSQSKSYMEKNIDNSVKEWPRGNLLWR